MFKQKGAGGGAGASTGTGPQELNPLTLQRNTNLQPQPQRVIVEVVVKDSEFGRAITSHVVKDVHTAGKHADHGDAESIMQKPKAANPLKMEDRPEMTDEKVKAFLDTFLGSPQLHINVTAPSREKVQPLVQPSGQFATPLGGIWTMQDGGDAALIFKFASMDHAINPDSRRMITRRAWAGREEMSYYCWHLYPSKDARVVIVNSREDLNELADRYGGYRDVLLDRSSFPFQLMRTDTINYLAVAKDFDALHVTASAVDEWQSNPSGLSLEGWDADTTCWFRWCFSKVKGIGSLADRFTNTPPLWRGRKVTADEYLWALKQPTREEKEALIRESEKLEAENEASRIAIRSTLDQLNIIKTQGGKAN